MPKLVAAAFLLLVKVSIRLVFPRCLWSFHLYKIKVPNYHWGSSSNLRITPLSSIELSFKVSNVSPEKCKETDNLLDKVKALLPSKQLLEDWTLHLPLTEMTSFLYPSSVHIVQEKEGIFIKILILFGHSLGRLRWTQTHLGLSRKLLAGTKQRRKANKTESASWWIG